MAGLSFNPAFRSAVLSTLREGVIQLALPQPEAARQPDFSQRALGEILGIPPDGRLSERFSAALNLLTFAAKNLPQEERPPVLAPLWGSELWRPEAAFKRGIVNYLEEAAKEACQVLGENSFLLSLAIWNKPDDASNWEVLLDDLEAKDARWAEKRRSFDKDPSGGWPKAIHWSWEPENDWRSGFMTKICINLRFSDFTDGVRHFQLVPEARFVRSFTIAGFRTMFLKHLHRAWPTFFFRRTTDLSLPRANPILRIDADLARALAAALPKSRIKRLDLTKSLFLGDAKQILKAAAQQSGIELLMRS